MFVVSSCEDADFTVSFMDTMFDAINGSSPFVNAIYPDNMTLEGRKKAVGRHLELKRLDASQKWEKAIETTTGQIAGMAMWNVYEREKPAEMDLDGPPGYWPTEDEREFARAIFRSFMEYRRKIMKETPGPVMCLSVMTVAPKYQYRGVGGLLMKSGTELADKIGALCVVESTTEGRHLYEQHGFIVDYHITLQVPQKFASKPKQRLFMMHRPKKEASTLPKSTNQQ